MKRIVKKLPNTPLEAWKRRCLPYQRVYTNLQDPDKSLVLAWLIREQGALCCYTGIRITGSSSHIEHLKPQTICLAEGNQEDVAGSNLLAAFPEQDDWPYGAKFRGHWYGEDDADHPADLFVHPLIPNCETRFSYDIFGGVDAANGRDAAAKTTIRKLGLDNGELADRRRGAIQAMLFDRHGPLSEAQIRKIALGLDDRNKLGEFIAFSFVLKQAAEYLLREIARKGARKRAIKQQKKRRR